MTALFRYLLSPHRWAIAAGLVIAGCASTLPLVLNEPAPLTQKFDRWVADFCTAARAAGIDEATVYSAFSSVHFLPRVIELDRAQPEFTRSVWDYLDRALSTQRILRGQEKLRQLQAEVDRKSVV